MSYRYTYNGKIWYFDQKERLELKQYQIEWKDYIPRFDLTVLNNSNTKDAINIFGPKLIKESQNISIEDIVSEHNYTYVAHYLPPWSINRK